MFIFVFVLFLLNILKPLSKGFNIFSRRYREFPPLMKRWFGNSQRYPTWIINTLIRFELNWKCLFNHFFHHRDKVTTSLFLPSFCNNSKCHPHKHYFHFYFFLVSCLINVPFVLVSMTIFFRINLIWNLHLFWLILVIISFDNLTSSNFMSEKKHLLISNDLLCIPIWHKRLIQYQPFFTFFWNWIFLNSIYCAYK